MTFLVALRFEVVSIFDVVFIFEDLLIIIIFQNKFSPKMLVEKRIVQRKFGSKNVSPKFFCSKKISVQNKFGPTKIWLKKILFKTKFGKKIMVEIW